MAADFCGDGYIVSFGFRNSDTSVGNKCALTDSNGKILQHLPSYDSKEQNIQIYRYLKSSEDGTKVIFSNGSTGANIYLYDLKEKKLKLISEDNVYHSVWSNNNNCIYYTTVKFNNVENSYFLNRYDF